MIELIGEKESIPAIQAKHLEIFSIADRLWQLVSPLVQSGQKLDGSAHFFLRWVTLAYYARQLRAFRAIVLLVERGLVPEAQKVLRPMIETHLHLDFISRAEDKPATARMYIVWEFANDEKLAGFVKGEERSKHADLFKTMAGLFVDERKRLGKDGWKEFVRYGPPRLGIEALARKQDFIGWYDTVYRRTSGPIHAFNILSYARPTESGFSVSLAPIDNGLDITLEAANALLMETALRVDNILQFGKEAEIRKLDEDIQKWLRGKLEAAG